MSTPPPPWFPLNSLQAQCDKGTWERGMALYRQADVVRVGLQQQAEGRWALAGEVQGSSPDPYEVSVQLVLALSLIHI